MDELEQLQAQIIDMQHKADALLAQRRASVIADIKAKIHTYKLTAKDLGLTTSTGKSSTVAAKYQLNDQTWTGRGRQPKFVADYVASGGTLDDLLIK